ncbi:L-ascorbate metabolism protein UlaG, beta-lactamase superfamily [Acinetobacter boissieri]|uniref:L-ascorbate metabolism protein UlaG, beta-lactamase superfamily n=2 Tax=Acinetobacter boissieri TaxID=1219383 RepID=A0A1G6HX94_9GAMM|nr:L-ascorbate metabolism protein UlaG, beta-lactamase superfamily [Acinetobacter boissieri]
MTLKPMHYQLVTQQSYLHCIQKPQWDYSQLDYFKNGRFYNQYPETVALTKGKLFKWLLSRKDKAWSQHDDFSQQAQQRSKTQIVDQAPDVKTWRIWYVNHATILIQIGTFNLLTDPIWADFAGPRQGLGPRRACLAGIALENLPRIDAVLLSHNHYDHMDLATLAWLHERFAMPIYTGVGNSYYLPSSWHVIEMQWGQSIDALGFSLTYTPAQHGSGRGIRDQNKALWGGFCIHYQEDYLYFAADTGYCPQFTTLYEQFGAPKVALLPIGAYEPRKIMKYLHMNPEDAVQAHLDLKSCCSIAIHHHTFQLTDEARDAPADWLRSLVDEHETIQPFYCLLEGQYLDV